MVRRLPQCRLRRLHGRSPDAQRRNRRHRRRILPRQGSPRTNRTARQATPRRKMMAKPKKPRRRRGAQIPDQAPAHVAGLQYAIPLAIPTYWTPEQAIAVFELVDDLREQIWSIYQTDLQQMIRQQRQLAPIDPLEIDDDDLPF